MFSAIKRVFTGLTMVSGKEVWDFFNYGISSIRLSDETVPLLKDIDDFSSSIPNYIPFLGNFWFPRRNLPIWLGDGELLFFF